MSGWPPGACRPKWARIVAATSAGARPWRSSSAGMPGPAAISSPAGEATSTVAPGPAAAIRWPRAASRKGNAASPARAARRWTTMAACQGSCCRRCRAAAWTETASARAKAGMAAGRPAQVAGSSSAGWRRSGRSALRRWGGLMQRGGNGQSAAPSGGGAAKRSSMTRPGQWVAGLLPGAATATVATPAAASVFQMGGACQDSAPTGWTPPPSGRMSSAERMPWASRRGAGGHGGPDGGGGGVARFERAAGAGFEQAGEDGQAARLDAGVEARRGGPLEDRQEQAWCQAPCPAAAGRRRRRSAAMPAAPAARRASEAGSGTAVWTRP